MRVQLIKVLSDLNVILTLLKHFYKLIKHSHMFANLPLEITLSYIASDE